MQIFCAFNKDSFPLLSRPADNTFSYDIPRDFPNRRHDGSRLPHHEADPPHLKSTALSFEFRNQKQTCILRDSVEILLHVSKSYHFFGRPSCRHNFHLYNHFSARQNQIPTCRSTQPKTRVEALVMVSLMQKFKLYCSRLSTRTGYQARSTKSLISTR